MATLNEKLAGWHNIYDNDAANKHLDDEVVAEFHPDEMKPGEFFYFPNMSGSALRTFWVTKGGYMVAFNENVNTGYTYPVKKISNKPRGEVRFWVCVEDRYGEPTVVNVDTNLLNRLMEVEWKIAELT